MLDALHVSFGEVVLPVHPTRPAEGTCIIKGERRHRPDAPISGEAGSLAEVADPYGCGIVYQPYVPRQRQYLATGRRLGPGHVELAVVAVYAEAFARDDVLAAGETIRHDRLTELTLAMLASLDQHGFFTFNWLESAGALRLTSVRPVPRAVFRTFRRAAGTASLRRAEACKWLPRD